jgi:RNA polymerase sigma factor FliA
MFSHKRYGGPRRTVEMSYLSAAHDDLRKESRFMTKYPDQTCRSIETDGERECVLLKQLPYVRCIARRIHNRLPRQMPFEDLVHAGVIGLIDALNKFDPSKHVQFGCYAKIRIRGAIIDSLRELDWSPRDLRRKGRLLESTHRQLSSKLGREPDQIEIAHTMGIGLPKFQSLLAELNGLEVGSLQVDYRDGKEGDLTDQIPSLSLESPFTNCLRTETKGLLVRAISALNANERRVLALYYFDELTMKEVGSALGLGESRVSQIHSRAIGRLRIRLHLMNEYGDGGGVSSAVQPAPASS